MYVQADEKNVQAGVSFNVTSMTRPPRRANSPGPLASSNFEAALAQETIAVYYLYRVSLASFADIQTLPFSYIRTLRLRRRCIVNFQVPTVVIWLTGLEAPSLPRAHPYDKDRGALNSWKGLDSSECSSPVTWAAESSCPNRSLLPNGPSHIWQ